MNLNNLFSVPKRLLFVLITMLLVSCGGGSGTVTLYTISGTINGLASTVVIQNNGGDSITVTADGAFIFATSLAQNDVYAITVSTQPTEQVCTVINANGAVATANVSNIAINCVTNTYSIGGGVTGLSGSVVLKNSFNDTLTVSADGSFTFARTLVNASAYNISIDTQPVGEVCNVTSNAGVVNSANISSVSVNCVAATYSVGGSVGGLAGAVTIQNNAGDDLVINANGNFTFATVLTHGSAYLVSVSAQPMNEACSVTNANGNLNGANVTNVSVNCVSTNVAPVTAAVPTLSFDLKTFRFTWADVSDATFYRLMENPDSVSGFTQVGSDIAPSTQTFDLAVSLYQRVNASYILQSCNGFGCSDAATTVVSGTLTAAVGYFKASTPGVGDEFGIDVALSSDGSTLAIGAKNEASAADGIDGDETDDTAANAGAVYVFIKSAGNWTQQAYIKASFSTAGDEFGTAVSLSADGNVLAVGAPQQGGRGAVFTYSRTVNAWAQTKLLKASPSGVDLFGNAVSLSDDGLTLAVGAKAEISVNPGVGATDDGLTALTLVGAAYIYIDSNTMGNWVIQEYIKANNANPGDFFGASVSLSSNGDTLAVGASGEDSDTSGIGSTSTTSGSSNGAVYVFTRTATVWTQEEYIKASNSGSGDNFGTSVSLSDDGDTLAVGAVFENSMSTGINGVESDNNALSAGAAYVFTRTATVWSQQAYVKASNTNAGDNLGRSISLSADGDTLVVGAEKEQSNATGINGDETDNSFIGSNGGGAAYIYTRTAGVWTQQAYVKANNTEARDFFGTAVELSGDANTLAVGADSEDGGIAGIGGNASNNGTGGSGAVYLY